MKTVALLFLIFVLAGLAPETASGQATSFTYQGQLRQDGEPFTGMADLEFRLYDQLVSGSQIGSMQSVANWPVEDGLFQVELDFGAGAFDGSDRFLEVTVDGASLSPRQKVTATPYALLATGLASGSVGGGSVDPTEVQLRVLGTCPAGEYIQEVNQDGSVVCGVDTDSGGTVTSIQTGAGLTGGPITESGTISVAPGGIGTAEIDISQVQARVGGSCPAGLFLQQVNQDGTVVCAADAIGNDWRLGGNAGTNPTTDFLGTTDATPLEFRTANVRSLRIEPSAEVFEGSPITTNTIAGSSANEVLPGIRGATISGGGLPSGDSDPLLLIEAPNRVTDHFGTVGGGYGNLAGDDSGTADDRAFATVAGGIDNTASGLNATVSGGRDNTASDLRATVGGGLDNTASDQYATVGGGWDNTASDRFATVGGGKDNTASGNRATIGGGDLNTASEVRSTVSGGSDNTASGTVATIGGGDLNTASGNRGTIGGGNHNTASGLNATVSGGKDNTASDSYATVSGGFSNQASGSNSIVAGGRFSCAGGLNSWTGGEQAKVRPNSASSFPSGTACNSVPDSGDGDGDEGTFVWADSTNTDFVSSGPNQFLVRASGGAGFGTNAPQAQLHVTEALNTSAGNPGNHVAIIENTAASTGNGPDVLALKTSAITPTSTSNFITFFDGSDTPMGRIDGTGGGVVLTSGGADFAEWLPKRDASETIEPGDIVGWHADGISLQTGGALRVMAVSNQPIVAGNAPDEKDMDAWTQVGFIGQVPVRVRGQVSAGDWIVASGLDDGTGVAVRAESLLPTQLGRVVGQALESSVHEGEHRINVAIGLGHERALGDSIARLQTQNADLRAQLADVEARYGDELAELRLRQSREMDSLRRDLALLRELVAPQIARRTE